MKLQLFTLLFSFIAISITAQNKDIENKANDYLVIPQVNKLQQKSGQFSITENTKISRGDYLKNEGNYLADMLSLSSGFDIEFAEENGDIQLILDQSIENNEGYQLSIRYDEITITGKTAKGVFYGIQTLRQLMPATIDDQNASSTTITIPAVDIVDAPRFSYRGMHLDVGRHFFPVDFIKTYIDMIAMHKMNTFHWHLTEDQGWRIEIKKYPKLTEIGAWRKETLIGHMSGKKEDLTYDGKRYGGFYTQEQIKDIVAYAEKRHITIIPEIDLPGHSLAALAAYPEFGNFGDQYEVGTYWGIYPQIYAPTEETFTFIEDILSEVAELFPSEYIHIGGDEALKDEWEKSEYAQELIKKEGLVDENGLQSYFIKRISKFLKSKNKKIIGWDEIIEGGLAPDATIMHWRDWKGSKEIIEAAEEGHNIIMTPTSYCYFDYYQVPKRQQKNVDLCIGGYLTAEKVYDFEPMPEKISENAKKHIIGGQGNVWTEYIKTPERVEYMALPRMTALSEVLWSEKENKDWKDFKKRLLHLSKRYDALELNYSKHELK